VEFDVHATADGRLVVFHDDWLRRTPISRLPFDEVRRHRIGNGEPVPTLAEAFEAIHPMVPFVEIKSLEEQWDERLLAAIEEAPSPALVACHSFDHRIIRRLSLARPSLPCGILLASRVVRPVTVMRDAGATAIWQHWQQIDPQELAEMKAAGASLYAWTADDPAVISALLRLGVDGVCTNHPDRARQAVDSLPS